MNRFVLLVGCFLALAAASHFDGPRYKAIHYFLNFKWKTHTSDSNFSGTNCDIRFDFGWLDAANRLIWYTKGFDFQDGWWTNPFETGTNAEFETNYDKKRYSDVEMRCSNASSEYEDYHRCITRPNILFFELRHRGMNGDWKLYMMDLWTTLNYVNQNGELKIAEHTLDTFKNRDGWTGVDSSWYLKLGLNGDKYSVSHGWPAYGKQF